MMAATEAGAPVQPDIAARAATAPHVPRIQLQGIVKTFPGVRALDGVDLEIAAGEVHVLFGENGAGKSTIINIIAGVLRPDGGSYAYEGKAVSGLTPHQARELGISAVFQEFSLVPELTVEQNIFLGREPVRAGFIDRRRMREKSLEVLARLGFKLEPQARIGRLSRAQQQMVEIAKAVLSNAKVLILDEPTASLTDAESERLFELVGELRQTGVSIIYVSHRMREISRIADRITVLRDGRRIATVHNHEVTDAQLIELMTGRKIDILFPPVSHKPGAVMLRTQGLTLAGGAVIDASIEVAGGEIVGIAGLAGCGKSELVRAVFGLEPITDGRVELQGSALTSLSPSAALRAGICYFPSDRATEGLVLGRPIRENASMEALDQATLARRGVLNKRGERSVITSVLERLKLRPLHIERQVGNLSGGNRQKVLLARGLSRPLKVYLFDEPTVGIDVGAKFEVYDSIKAIVEEGNAVVLVSSELPEIMGLSNRIYVMHAGRVVAQLPGKGVAEADILAHFFPHEPVSVDQGGTA